MTRAAAPTGGGIAPDRSDDANPPRRDAALRLSRYFAGFGVTEPSRLEPLVAAALASAPALSAAEGDVAAAGVLDAAEARVAGWFARVLLGREPGDDAERAALLLTGRAAFLLCGGPARWPDAFLRELPPGDFVAAMREAAAEAAPTPPPAASAMPAQDLAFWSPAALVPPRLVRPAHAVLALLLGPASSWR